MFLQNFFMCYYWKFKKLVIFHEIVRNISACGFRCKMRYYELFLHCKGARGKVSFDSLNVKYASKLSCDASPEAYLSHLSPKMTNTLFNFLSDNCASGEASKDNCEAHLSFCESNDTSPRAPFTVWNGCKLYPLFPVEIGCDACDLISGTGIIFYWEDTMHSRI
jgi:hypothetical protein